MADYKAPLRDMQFVLNEVFAAEKLWADMPGTQEVSSDLMQAILEEGAKICENLLYPLNRSGDEQGCTINNGEVSTPEGFKQAYQQFAEGGWIGLGGSPEYGGQGLPKMLTVMFEEMLFAANTSFTLYPVLCSGACLAILKHASETLKQQYLPKMYAGEWAGTMCLTEPHSGTDLGLLRTKATPNTDNSFNITGTKIFITGGEHDLTNNIIHLVLAKLPDAPSGSRGISLFLVPKFLINEDGSLGERNNATCGSIEHKMGIKGSATCVMNFDGAKGWLVGAPNKGLTAMFTMMNYERLSIGIQGQGTMDMGYQHALAYAKERLQGRSPLGPQAPNQSADPIIVHPDVQRMLLTIKAFSEAGRALAAYTGMQLDIAKFHEDATVKAKAERQVMFLTPIAKAFLTDRGLECAVLAQQVFGGHGYIREWSVEQLVRDVRIAQIYEGTNGIQAMDLVARKLCKAGLQIIEPFMEDAKSVIAQSHNQTELTPLAQALTSALEEFKVVSQTIVDRTQTDPLEAGSVAVEYLEFAGLVICGFVWLKMALVASQCLAEEKNDFYESKLKTAQFFYQKLLPKTEYLAKSLAAGSEPLATTRPEHF